jgi:hypothetical protein
MPDTPHDIPRYVDPAIMRADLEEAVREWMIKSTPGACGG